MFGHSYFGAAYFGAGFFGGAAAGTSTEPIYAVSTFPISALDEPGPQEIGDLLRLADTPIIDVVYLLELTPFAPAGSSLPT